MSNDYSKVQDELDRGTAPEVLCRQCPWDRYCVVPPTMTRDEVNTEMAEAKRKDRLRADQQEAAGKPVGIPVETVVAALSLSRLASTLPCCPVFILRLRSNRGKKIAELAKEQMQHWPTEKETTT